MKSKVFFVSIISILLSVLSSCTGKEDEPRLYLKDFYWAPTTEESDVEDAQNLEYKKSVQVTITVDQKTPLSMIFGK